MKIKTYTNQKSRMLTSASTLILFILTILVNPAWYVQFELLIVDIES